MNGAGYHHGPKEKPLLLSDVELVQRHNEGTSILTLAKEAMGEPKKIRRHLREAGGVLRGRSAPSTTLRMNAAERLVPAQVIDYYAWGASLEDVARAFGVNQQTVRRVLVKNDIEIRPATSYSRTRRWPTVNLAPFKPELVKRYLVRGESLTDLARLYGVSDRQMRDQMSAWTELRSSAEARRIMHRQIRQLTRSKAVVVQAFKDGQSPAEIAEAHTVGETVVKRVLGAEGLDLRVDLPMPASAARPAATRRAAKRFSSTRTAERVAPVARGAARRGIEITCPDRQCRQRVEVVRGRLAVHVQALGRDCPLSGSAVELPKQFDLRPEGRP